MPDIDDELQDLLDQLDEQDDVVEQLEDEIGRITEDEAEAIEDGAEVIEDESTVVEFVDTADNAECALRPVDTRRIDDIEALISESVETVSIDIIKYHERLDQVTADVLMACRADRQEAQDVINLLRLQIDDAVNKSHAPQRMWVDGLVKAVEVKAGINATAVKIIEANAKMLAATRAGINILNQNISTSSQDLEEILNQPITEIDEY